MKSPVIRQNPTDSIYADFTCPTCSFEGFVDKDQYEGRVSIRCPTENCFHEMIDFRKRR